MTTPLINLFFVGKYNQYKVHAFTDTKGIAWFQSCDIFFCLGLNENQVSINQIINDKFRSKLGDLDALPEKFQCDELYDVQLLSEFGVYQLISQCNSGKAQQ